jgi:flagellar biosynthesis/type III secretory pathway chaperone
MTSDTAIISILKEQVKSYKLLHDLLKKERVCLVDMDSGRIEEISKGKDTIIMRLRLLEEERQRLIRQFADDNYVDVNINLEELGRLTGNTVFHDLRSQLLSILQSIEEMNKFNSILIERTIRYIRTNTGFFKSFTGESMVQSSGVLLSKET